VSWYKNYVESLCRPPEMRSIPSLLIHHNTKCSGLLSLVASLHPAQALHLRASSNNTTSKKNDHAPTNESLAVLHRTGPKRTKCITFCNAPLPSLSSHNKRHTNNLNKKNYNRVSYGNSEFSQPQAQLQHPHAFSILQIGLRHHFMPANLFS
jgi:hypothetical protein